MTKITKSVEITVIDDKKGFTLIEVMVAISLLAIGLLGLSMVQVAGIKNNSLGYSSTQANHLAEKHMEMIIHSDYHAQGISDMANNNESLETLTNVDHFNTDAQGNGIDLGKYNLIINVADNTPVSDTKTIVVMVTWDNDRKVRKLSCIKTLTS
jgi:type IV pilus assembly protein PilV